jgi:MFS family permease
VPRSFSFGRLIAGIVFLNAASGVLFAVLPLLEVTEGGGPLLATLIVGAPLLAQVLATFLWGALSDRWGRRRELLTIGILGESVLFLAYPFLNPIGLLAVRIIQVFLGAASILATTVVTEDPTRSAGRGLGDLNLWGGIGGVLGVIAGFPFLGGSQFTAHTSAAIALFALLALLSVASVLCLAFSGELGRPKGSVPLTKVLRFRSGFWVAKLAIAAGVVGLANYIVYTLFPLFIQDILAPNGSALFGASLNPTQQLALLSIGAGMGGVLSASFAGRAAEGVRRRRILYLTAPLVYAALWVGFAVLRSYPAIFLLWSFPAAILFQIPITREVAALTPMEERGRAVGLLLAVYYFGGLIGAAIAGLGVEKGISFTTQFLLAAVIDVIGFAVLLLVLRRKGGIPTAPGYTVAIPGGAPSDGNGGLPVRSLR